MTAELKLNGGEKSRLLTHISAIALYKSMIADAEAVLKGDKEHDEFYRMYPSTARVVLLSINSNKMYLVNEELKLAEFKATLAAKYEPSLINEFIDEVLALLKQITKYAPQIGDAIKNIIELIKKLF